MSSKEFFHFSKQTNVHGRIFSPGCSDSPIESKDKWGAVVGIVGCKTLTDPKYFDWGLFDSEVEAESFCVSFVRKQKS